MARLIPNQQTWVGFATSVANINAITQAEVVAAVDLTSFVISINAATQGNIVQTPAFDNRFETNIPGTLQATFEGDFYRDTTADTAWTTLARDVVGFMIISRYGGSAGPTLTRPITGTTKVEVWPVRVATRSAQNLTNNTAQTFHVQCSISALPNENVTVA